MKTIFVALVFLTSFFSFGQTSFKTIASNRMIQNHQSQSNLRKIETSDPVRLQTLWQYFSNSYSFSDLEEPTLTLEKLMNIYHFDITQYEQMREQNAAKEFIFRGSIKITLKSIDDLTILLQGYNLSELTSSIPMRSFPSWTYGEEVTEVNFQLYKNAVYDWAKDFPDEYLNYTQDTSVIHVSFKDFQLMGTVKRSTLLTESAIILID